MKHITPIKIYIIIFILFININSKEYKMKLVSTSYLDNQDIPIKYCRQGVTGGQNISPQLSWDNFPPETKSFILAIVDHHPVASNWVHWLVINIPPNVSFVAEGASKTSKMPSGSIELLNTFGAKGYDGPQPPRGTGKHYYDATIYALNIANVNLSGEISEAQLLREIKPNIIGEACLRGLFGR